jgi:hypothetical protein
LEETVNVAGVVPAAGETVSHDPLVTLAVKEVLGLAVKESDCEPGEAPPAVALNDRVAGLTLSVDAGFTVKVTWIVAVRPLPVTVMVPAKGPADSPVTLEDTVRVAGVVPVLGETLSHDPPLTLAVKVAFGLALTARLCEAGDTPPAVALNDNVPGLTLSVDAGFTVNVTGIVAVWPLPATVTEPVKVPADSPETLDETVSVAGVVPVAGETLSHDPPLTLAA